MAGPSRPRPAVLCILDGWGHRPDPKDNAILDARTPNYDRLIATCPQALIDASETFVGLPKGQMGNSEVGHMNLGGGRVAVPDLPRIDNAIEDGSLARNPVLTDFIARLKKSGGACHLMGLTSPGGVHAHQDHLIMLANLIATGGSIWRWLRVPVIRSHSIPTDRFGPGATTPAGRRRSQADCRGWRRSPQQGTSTWPCAQTEP